MKVTPDDYGRRCQFDHFCKLVLYHEAVDYSSGKGSVSVAEKHPLKRCRFRNWTRYAR